MPGNRYDYEKFTEEIEKFRDRLEKGEHIIITEDESSEFFGRSIRDAKTGHCMLEKGDDPKKMKSTGPTIPCQLGLKGYSSKLSIVNNEKCLEVWKPPPKTSKEIDKTVPDVLDRIYKEVYNIGGDYIGGEDIKPKKERIEEAKKHLIEAIKILSDIIEEKNINKPILKKWMKDRIELWCRIYNEGGIITKEKLYRIWRKMGKDPRSLDEFFIDKKPTLSWTPNSIVLTKHVVLTEHASEAIEAWTGKTISEYAKKFKK